MPKSEVYLDGGVLLNLSVLDQATEIFATLPVQCMIAPVMDTETYELGNEDEPHTITVHTFVTQGVMMIADPLQEEGQQLMLELACQGVRGSLAYLAAAATIQQAKLATDSNRSVQLLRQLLPQLPLLTTATLLHEWQQEQHIDEQSMLDVLHQVEERARFTPPEHDPLCAWWRHPAMP
jgi:hypothetical protein